jgi:hypothetical protein
MEKKMYKSNSYAHLVAKIIIIFSALLVSYGLMAQAPPDNFYSGGPDAFASVSETWHLKDVDPNPSPPAAEHPVQGHTKPANGGEPAVAKYSLYGKVITLRQHGTQWFLIPGPNLSWSPTTIPLQDHPSYVPWGGALQWRWVNTPPIMIDGHAHDICIGFADSKIASRRDDDIFWVSVTDRVAGTAEPDCKDPGDVHPGHANAGR